jgi:hypothetical protein
MTSDRSGSGVKPVMHAKGDALFFLSGGMTHEPIAEPGASHCDNQVMTTSMMVVLKTRRPSLNNRDVVDALEGERNEGIACKQHQNH